MRIRLEKARDLMEGPYAFTEQQIRDVVEMVWNQKESFLKKIVDLYKRKYNINIDPYIQFYMDRFEMAIIDALDDLKRLKEFHQVPHPNTLKYAAYLSYWWIQRKPLAIEKVNKLKIPPKAKVRLTSFNEFFCVLFVLTIVFNRTHVTCCNTELERKYLRDWDDAEGYLFYLFCYRANSPKNIEAFLSAATLHPFWEIRKGIRDNLWSTDK